MTHPPDAKKSDEGELESGHREDPLIDPIEESRMPLWGHLHELRQGMIRSLVIVSLAFCVSYAYVEPLIVFLERPLLDLLPEGSRHLYFTGLTDKFFIYLKVSFLAAACLVSPYLLYEVWRFISPALHKHERKFAGPFIFLGSFAFFVGLAFSYHRSGDDYADGVFLTNAKDVGSVGVRFRSSRRDGALRKVWNYQRADAAEESALRFCSKQCGGCDCHAVA
jgi:hypothetical protein